jgi:hypothetical protein
LGEPWSGLNASDERGEFCACSVEMQVEIVLIERHGSGVPTVVG